MINFEKVLDFAKDLILTASSQLLEADMKLSVMDDFDYPLNYACPFIGMQDDSGLFLTFLD